VIKRDIATTEHGPKTVALLFSVPPCFKDFGFDLRSSALIRGKTLLNKRRFVRWFSDHPITGSTDHPIMISVISVNQR
jgi:hypothetical protein